MDCRGACGEKGWRTAGPGGVVRGFFGVCGCTYEHADGDEGKYRRGM